MSKRISRFQFKRFSVSHHRSSMKVGIDGVLVACWADVASASRILDVGTGCGLIALIMAQRAPEAMIEAIDIDHASIEEAKENVAVSPWPERIVVKASSFSEEATIRSGEFDLIVSNPPYFDAGVNETRTAREKARHQGELSPSTLLEGARKLLTSGGEVAMVVPADMSMNLEDHARSLGYLLKRKCLVRGHAEAPFKRALLQWKLKNEACPALELYEDSLTIESSPSVPTDEYRALCKDFYLNY